MGNKGYANKAKSGQKALPAKLKRVKAKTSAARSDSRKQRKS